MAFEGDAVRQFREDACFTIYAVCCALLAYFFLPLVLLHGSARMPIRFFQFNLYKSCFLDCLSVKACSILLAEFGIVCLRFEIILRHHHLRRISINCLGRPELFRQLLGS